jgi:hypothetical protein
MPILVIIILLLIPSCTTTHLNVKQKDLNEEVVISEDFDLPKEFWKEKKDLTLAWYSEKDYAEYYATDKFVPIPEADKPKLDYKLIRRLQDEDLEPHIKKFYLEGFRKILASDGHKIKIEKEKLQLKKEEKTFSLDRNVFDFSNISSDYVLVAYVKYFGINVEFDEDVSTQMPQVVTKIQFLVYDRISDKLIAQKSFMQIDDVQGKWDFPPIYVKMFASLAEVYRNVIKDAQNWLISE